MYLFLKLMGASLVSILLAAGLLASKLKSGVDKLSVANGDWRISMVTGSEEADVMTRAIVAIGGLLASRREDSMYYRLASVDGEPLRLDCTYRLRGSDYDADWWSITAYGWDHYLIPNSEDRFSFNGENVRREADGSWELVVSAAPKPGNWLPVAPAGGKRQLGDDAADFDLILRLYTPGEAYLNSAQTAPLPTVEREHCE